ncbi:ATP-binding cassette domain-containing protein [candidate division KSB1 bacterium]|nr:ATP-binding cassette domain-containing protein [candidate division KSB1 bacterium]NIR73147.1 ATP-binding cassette domain-containing protein [candidate division KSB1 bacterium]NIS23850.1 ATP-binding cassette domain-containing protein [candidate division KSB1 bacterium]NIT70771.1 ATP-binding cassette domain-containing protein [candidate division KSB1 bacterium]NIU24499.1 ATP-binding cassette domain-containing protein [candidate division KSB1 bacterium]
MKIIELENVSYSYKENVVLRNLNLAVNKRENLVILGGSGAGKSTILKLILGLLTPDTGCIKVLDHDITNLKEKQIQPIRHRMGMVFQGGALFDSMHVWENVGYCMLENHDAPMEKVHENVREKLAFVDLEHAFDYLPAELSGGMRKRVAIARAIVCDPEIVLFDEPTSGLDPIATKSINQLITRLRDEKWVSSVVVTHILKDAFAVANRVAMLKNGEIVFEGGVEDLQRSKDPYIREFVQ